MLRYLFTVFFSLLLALCLSDSALADDTQRLSVGALVANRYRLVETRQETLGDSVITYYDYGVKPSGSCLVSYVGYNIEPYLNLWYGYRVTSGANLVDSGILGITYNDAIAISLGVGLDMGEDRLKGIDCYIGVKLVGWDID